MAIQQNTAIDDALIVWLAALESGFTFAPNWQSWADTEIVALDEPPLWLIHLSLANTTEEALVALWDGGSQLPSEVWQKLNLTALHLGFLYLRFKRGDFNLAILLERAGIQVDSSDFEIECEAFYFLLNELDGLGPIHASDRPLLDRVEDLFGPMIALARERWSNLSMTNV